MIRGEINPLDSENFANLVEKLFKRSLGGNLKHLNKVFVSRFPASQLHVMCERKQYEKY
jgi:hypothetical protein